MSKKIRIWSILASIAVLLACSVTAFTLHAKPAYGHPLNKQVRAISTEANNFYNPIIPDLADPSVLFYNGSYFFTYSDGTGNVYVEKSQSLTRLGNGNVATVWTHPGSGDNCCEVWAPELKLINGSLYIYFSADDGNNDNHRMYALQADSGDPQGSYSFRGKVAAATDRWAIDGIPAQQGNNLYFVWSGWEGTANGQQNLYIAQMSDPWTIIGDRARISAPDRDLETVDINGFGGIKINEAPQSLARNGKIFITYSANGSTTDNYCLGMLTASDSADLMDPNSWSKSDGPVFTSVDTVYGPGSNTFTTSPDGSEDWIVYNATILSGNGPTDNWKNRSIRTQKFGWDSNGNPVFGTPASVTTALPLPSGEQRSAIRYEAELASVHDANIIIRTGEHSTYTAASHDADVGQMDNGDSYVDFTVDVSTSGTYTMTEGYSNGFNVTASHNISVNGNDIGATNLPSTGAWNQFSTSSIDVQLNAGTNTIRVAHGSNWSELDYIELPAS